MLAAAAVNALLMMAAAVAAAAFGFASLPAAAHIAFALGVLPLILAAMAYFVPVLTRGGAAPRWVSVLPYIAGGAGLLLLAGFAGLLSFAAASHGAGLLAAMAALSLLYWTVGRARKTLGKPHPGLSWYIAALVFLVLALTAVAIMPLWPQGRQALRLFHLHANLLGFVGLTAIGTLQVLLPTTLARPDPDAARRLAGDLKFSAAGSLLIALGAAGQPLVASIGAFLYLFAPLRMGAFWLARFGKEMRMDNASSSLAVSCAALLALTLLGILHAYDLLSGHDAVQGFVIAFLLPLVSGAAAQLLPIWLRPGPQKEWHASLRQALGRYSGWRALLFAAGGIGMALAWDGGLWPALAGIALLFFAAAGSLRFMR